MEQYKGSSVSGFLIRNIILVGLRDDDDAREVNHQQINT